MRNYDLGTLWVTLENLAGEKEFSILKHKFFVEVRIGEWKYHWSGTDPIEHVIIRFISAYEARERK